MRLKNINIDTMSYDQLAYLIAKLKFPDFEVIIREGYVEIFKTKSQVYAMSLEDFVDSEFIFTNVDKISKDEADKDYFNVHVKNTMRQNCDPLLAVARAWLISQLEDVFAKIPIEREYTEYKVNDLTGNDLKTAFLFI